MRNGLFSSFFFWHGLSFIIGIVSYISGVWSRYSYDFDSFFLLSVYFVPSSVMSYITGMLFSYYLSNQYRNFFVNYLLNKSMLSFNITIDKILTQLMIFFIFKTTITIIYSFFFKKIHDHFSGNKFIIVCILLIIFGAIFMLSINMYVGLQKLFSIFVIDSGSLFGNIMQQIKVANNYSSIILNDLGKMCFSNFTQLILTSWNLGFPLFILGITLFHLTLFTGIFISFIGNGNIKVMFLNLDNHKYYLYWLLGLCGLSLFFFYVYKIHFISYLLLSIVIGCGFLFFLVGRDILQFLIISVVGMENFIITYLIFRLIIMTIPSFLLILTIVGFLDVFFDIKKKILFI